MKIITTLCLLTTNEQVLLGYKKRGFGVNRWNGFGGKVHAPESLTECARREVLEECGIKAKDLNPCGLMRFHFENSPNEIEVHLFEVTEFEGEPVETEEMRPQWFNKIEIPFDQMWPDDKFWFPLFLQHKNFAGEFFFRDQDNLADYKIAETIND